MEFSKLEQEAERKAASHVANMLHTPDKLEKVHQMKWNVSRKKASVEAMLKTAMQSQLDGVKNGLSQLEKALADMREIKTSMDEIEKDLQVLPGLLTNLEALKEETSRHSQLATAQENLKHLFTVPETVRQAEAAILDGKLLEAHKSLVELENSRDDLLYELHKLSGPYSSTVDKELLKEYFAPVTELSNIMEKQIKFILRRTLNTVRKDPRVIVTALRIIEREERADRDFAQRQKTSGFLPPDRPKLWKSKCLAVLKTNVQERIEGNQLDVREENKMWLVRHLELIRLITLEDLRVAKTLCQPVFPPSYLILDHFMDLYHEALSNRLQDIINMGLENQEFTTILSWVIQTYPGKELMRSTSLGIPNEKIKPLLDNHVIQELQKQYLENMADNYTEWMKNTLSLETEDWRKAGDPETDNEDYFHTSAPKIIYQMIDENLQVASTISPELTSKVLVLGMTEVTNFGTMYRNAVVDYKNKYFRDRTAISLFTRYMIAIVNNCERFEESAQELKSRWWKSGLQDQESASKFEVLLTTFQTLRGESAGYLLDESFLDIDIHFSDLLTAKWMTSTDAIDTVCATLDDYFDDYKYLRPKNFELVFTEAQDRVARRYMTSMLQPSANPLRQKVSLKTTVDRREAAEKIKTEAGQLKRFFHKRCEDMADFDSPFDALALLAEVLISDEDMLFLDIGTLVKRYPDITNEQVVCLLILRGDISKGDAKNMALDCIPETRQAATAKSIFSQVQVSSSLNPFATGKEAANLNPFVTGKEVAASLNPFSSNKASEKDLNPFNT